MDHSVILASCTIPTWEMCKEVTLTNLAIWSLARVTLCGHVANIGNFAHCKMFESDTLLASLDGLTIGCIHHGRNTSS